MKTLEECVREVQQFCMDKGWYDTEVSVVQAGVLVCTEVAELYEAWRENGFADSTVGDKPEGFGSELADILIRLFDDIGRFNWTIPPDVVPFNTAKSISESFGINDLNKTVAALFTLGASLSASTTGVIMYRVKDLATKAGIDLEFEYERKMAYNRSRPYRHGGKKA